MNHSPQRILALAFFSVTAIIICLWMISLFSLDESTEAVDTVLENSRLVRLAKEATTNLTRAGQLPKKIETATEKLMPLLQKEMESLQEQFYSIREDLQNQSVSNTARVIAEEFLKEGELFYQSLADFFPIKEKMLVYITEYKGDIRTLVDVLSQRELDHIHYMRALRESLQKKKLLVGTLDPATCGFSRWYKEHLPKDEGIAEIILEEMDPLHKNLHYYAAQIGKLLNSRKYQQAELLLAEAESDLARLGIYFSGVRALAEERQREAQKEFAHQVELVDGISRQANDIAIQLEKVLIETDLEPSLLQMRRTTGKGRTLIWIFSILGTILSIIIAVGTFRRIRTRTIELEMLTSNLEKAKKRTEKQTLEMTQILDVAASGIRVVDTNYIVRRVNKKFLGMANLTKGEVVGRKCFDVFSGSLCHTPNCPLVSVSETLRPISSQVDKTNINGTVIPCVCTAAPFLDTNGKLLGIVEDFRDITELLETEKEKEVLQSRLVQAQKLEAVGKLAAGIAHEINTPTQYIESNIDFLSDAFNDISDLLAHYKILLENTKKGSVTSEQIDAVDNALEEADWDYLEEEVPSAVTQAKEGTLRVSTIVRAMKEFSHPSSKEKVPSDLVKIITTTTTVCQNEWKNVAELEMDFASDLPLVPVIANEIGQVILNIMVNASHAISDKLGNNSEGEKGTIKITAKIHSENAEVTITDSGSGMPEEVQKQIFDPFYTTKEVGRGSGQGLAIVHDVITNKHGGSIYVESELGKGTTFIIQLPLSA